MKLLVDRLTDAPTRFEFEGGAGWWREMRAELPGLEEVEAEPFHFELSAHRMGADIYVEGVASGALLLGCSRCLARYRHALREPFRLVLEPAGSRVPVEPDAAAALARDGLCLGDELESGWFSGRELELGPFFREVIALALPVQPLCGEQCQGLCPHCGIDRNVERCECVDTPRESPFQVLRALREGKSGES
jgi:uncharacterized protein